MRIFVPTLAAHARVLDQDLLEKDVRLHLLLQALAEDEALDRDLIFKGGTCLIKCYLDYPRFSTDLDFTWRGDAAWLSLGTKALRRAVRPVQRRFLARLEKLAGAQGFRFSADRDVQYGQSNRMMTVILHYESVLRLPGMVKVQANFTEPIVYKTRAIEARSLLHGELPPTMRLLDSDIPARYSRAIRVEAYDPREILAEKGRAILTRTAAKTRDLLDLYLLEARLGLKLEDHRKAVMRKTMLSISVASRHRYQLETAEDRFGLLLEEDVKPLLLKPINETQFEEYRVRAVRFLEAVAKELRQVATT